MTETRVAAPKPILAELETGRYYYWCRCGRGRQQPFRECTGDRDMRLVGY